MKTTRERLRFLQPDTFITFLNELAAAEAGTEQTVRGYKVKTRFKPVERADADTRKQAIAQALMRRGRRNDHRRERLSCGLPSLDRRAIG